MKFVFCFSASSAAASKYHISNSKELSVSKSKNTHFKLTVFLDYRQFPDGGGGGEGEGDLNFQIFI